MSKTAFVTGGTGFLGINLLRALCDQGWTVTALHRPTSDLTYIKDLPIQLVEGSITDKASLEKALPASTEVVFHVAGDVSMWSKHNDRQTAINVDGTRNMVEVAAKKGVHTFIHTSSISAWGQVSGMTDEATPQKGATSWVNYEKTKWQGEQEAFKGMDLGMKVVAINAGSILGAFDTSSWAQMFYALRDNKAPGVPPGVNSFVHVDDVVSAHILAVDKGQNGHNYILSGHNISIQTLAREIAQVMGIQKVPPKFPAFLIKTLARLAAFGAYFTGKEPALTPENIDILSRPDFRFSNAKALRELGYEMKPWQDGVKECYDWLKGEGLI